MNEDSNITSDMSTIMNLIPIIMIMLPFIHLYCWITGKTVTEYYEERMDRKAEETLKQRYANGEIDSFEYTERMARL